MPRWCGHRPEKLLKGHRSYRPNRAMRRGTHSAMVGEMCRWNAYHGQPLLLDELLFRTQHGLIDQSLHSRMGAETTNGDGFGLGWYVAGREDDPGRYRSVEPAWNDANLRDLAKHIESP